MNYRPAWKSLAVALAFQIAPSGNAQAPDGAALYEQRCAVCHDQPTDQRAPARAALAALSPEHLVAAMLTGTMSVQATGLAADAVNALALYLSELDFGDAAASQPQPNLCAAPAPPLDLSGPQWNGWGLDLHHTRFQPQPGFTAAEVPRLRLKWAYAYPGQTAYGQPTLIGDRVFVTSQSGQVSALDAATGCAYWTYEAGSGVRTAVTVAALPGGARIAAFFGDDGAFAHAIDASTGEPIWRTEIDDHAVARITGAPTLYEGRLYVPVSSVEEAVSRGARYECCTFRGAIAALAAGSGEILWKSHSIPQAPQPYRLSTAGTQNYGPAGGAIWSSPTVDAARGLIYAGTGNSYTDVATDGTNAIVAFDLETGERRWVRQVTEGDNYLIGCGGASAGQNNCPATEGPDVDFGASVILRTLTGGRDILLAGQKSGVVYGLDPADRGAIRWQTTVGSGSPLGGIEWGMAADDTTLYVANSDIYAVSDPQPGLSAIRIADGEKLWHVPAPPPACSWSGTCRNSQSAAVTAIPGAVFSGAMDGHLRAYAAHDGSILWDFDTGRPFNTVNGLTLSGGHLDGPGPTVAGGRLFVNSGTGNWGGRTARLLLVFSVDAQ